MPILFHFKLYHSSNPKGSLEFQLSFRASKSWRNADLGDFFVSQPLCKARIKRLFSGKKKGQLKKVAFYKKNIMAFP